MGFHRVTKGLIEVVGELAPATADDLEIAGLYQASRSAGGSDLSEREDLPPAWQNAISSFDFQERRIFSSISTIFLNYSVEHVGAVRRIPEEELLRAYAIGPTVTALLKALGHYPDREITFRHAVSAYDEKNALNRQDRLDGKTPPQRSIEEILALAKVK